MELTSLYYFVTVAKELHFRRANFAEKTYLDFFHARYYSMILAPAPLTDRHKPL